MYKYISTLLLVSVLLVSVSNAKVFEYEENNVIVANGKTIDSIIKSNNDLIVYFYTKTKESEKFMNVFLKVSNHFHEDESTIRFAVLDLEKDFATKSKFIVQDPITVVYYKNGNPISDFILPKNAPSLKAFAEDPVAPIPALPGIGSWKDIESKVYHLTKRNFTTFTQIRSSVLVMFYAPGCSHCQKMKPAFAEAAAIVQKEKLGVFAAYDCNADMSICEQLKIKGFPTPLYFQNGKNIAQYSGDRSENDLVEWMRNPLQPSPSAQKKIQKEDL